MRGGGCLREIGDETLLTEHPFLSHTQRLKSVNRSKVNFGYDVDVMGSQ